MVFFQGEFSNNKGKKIRKDFNVSLWQFCVLIQNLGTPTSETDPNAQSMEFMS